ncbi:MAG TPA: anthrone oxygenase family protein, partial [Dehalococcoidia bacterium]|nr:anthrone oxygenase family protein [Dehalococcoidia bacterium]
LTLANLVVAWRAQGATRRWWLGAAAAAVVDRIFTFAYFIPTMLKLQRAEALPESEVVAMAVQWKRLDYVRHAIVLVAWLAALKGLSLLSKHGG